jgi:hypothetical protein
MKINLIYMIIYITLLVFFILISFCIIEFLSFVSRLPFIDSIVGDFRDYTLGMNQPVMILPNLTYRVVNLYPLHTAYYFYLFWVTICLIIILLLWLIGTIVQKIIFVNPFASIPPWAELNEMGFFEWFFEKTLLDKNKDIINFILNIFKAVLSPEQYEAAQQRCMETFESKKDDVEDIKDTTKDAIKDTTKDTNQLTEHFAENSAPFTLHIDYDLTHKYNEDRLEDIFYTDSFKSIKHREEANKYRKMKIIRPDLINNPIPDLDIENTINTNMHYMNI